MTETYHLPYLGTVKIEDRLIEYDGPRLFTVRSENGSHFVGFWAIEKPEESVFWYAPAGDERYNSLLQGDIDLRDIFEKPEANYILETRFANGESWPSIFEYKAPTALDSEAFPESGYRLNIYHQNIGTVAKAAAKHHRWSELVREYTAREERYGEPLPPPATDAEIETMKEAATAERLVVDPDYLDFLKIRNGTSFNGLMLYGAAIPNDDPYKRLDLVIMNVYQSNREDATVLGTTDIDVYVIAGPKGPYRRLDRSSWDVIDEFESCDELLFSIFTDIGPLG